MDMRQSNLIRNFKVRKLTQSYDINTCIQNKKDQAQIYLHVHNTHTIPQASPNIKSYKYANTNFHTYRSDWKAIFGTRLHLIALYFIASDSTNLSSDHGQIENYLRKQNYRTYGARKLTQFIMNLFGKKECSKWQVLFMRQNTRFLRG